MTKESKIADAIKTASNTANASGGMSFGDIEMVDINPKNKETKRPKTGWRQKKEDEDKASESIMLKVTPKQLAELKKVAGLVPVSTYIKHILKSNGYLND